MIKANPRVLFQKLGEEAVLLHLDSEEYYGLNSVALRTWEILLEQQSEEKTIALLLEEFDIDEATLKADYKELYDDLISKKLILVD